MVVQHRPGKKHLNADTLSRRPQEEPECTDYKFGMKLVDLPCGGCAYCTKAHKNWAEFAKEVDDAVPLSKGAKEKRESRRSDFMARVMKVNTVDILDFGREIEVIVPALSEVTVDMATEEWDIKSEQGKDSDLQILATWLGGGAPTENDLFSASPAAKYYWITKDSFTYDKEIIVRKHLEGEYQQVVPKTMQQEVIEAFHDLPSSVHQGPICTKWKIRDKFFWHHMSWDIKFYVATCAVCI